MHTTGAPKRPVHTLDPSAVKFPQGGRQGLYSDPWELGPCRGSQGAESKQAGIRGGPQSRDWGQESGTEGKRPGAGMKTSPLGTLSLLERVYPHAGEKASGSLHDHIITAR